MSTQATPKIAQGTPEFSVEWPSPADAQYTWVWDAMHCPYPLTPLSIDLFDKVFESLSQARGLRSGETFRHVYPHGYVYGIRWPPADPSAPPDSVVEERKRRDTEAALRLRQIWEKDTLPRIVTICRTLQGSDYASLSLKELAHRLEDYVDRAAEVWTLTLVVASPMFACSQFLVDFCKEESGSEGEAMAAAIMEGFANASSASDIAFWKLAQLATALPAVDQALRNHTAEELLTIIPNVDGGASFIEAFRRYLDQYGWRPEIWFELSLPTWRDDPRSALRLIQRYLVDGGDGPLKALDRSARRRRQMVQKVRSRLCDQPNKLGHFNALVATAQQYVPVREGRAFWQLTVCGNLRVPCLALGEKLSMAGVLRNAEDIFYLRLSETQQMATDLNAMDWKPLVAERRAERQRWMQVVPPLTIGAPVGTAAAGLSSTHGRFAGIEEEAGKDARILRGNAASRGVVQAPAKVALTLEEADKLQRGDVLVCRTTSPAWTFLFARASAVVSDSGSVLAHTAIVAREYAIPCVVGVGVGTERIRDGMLITVDGTQGIVRLDE